MSMTPSRTNPITPILFLLLTGSFALRAQDQVYNTVSNWTPASEMSGTPEGSYLISPHEAINMFNGTVNFVVPLHKIEGRGAAGYTMVLPINSKWKIDTHVNGIDTSFVPLLTGAPLATAWQPLAPPRYSPGVLSRRDSWDETGGSRTCPVSGMPGGGYGINYDATLTTIVWTGADGTEHTLRDVGTSGVSQTVAIQSNPPCSTDPYNNPIYGFNRGTVFESDDSTAMTFVADSAVYDAITTIRKKADSSTSSGGVSGWILFKDGTRYYIDSTGKVTLIEDRVGNKTTLDYTSGLKVTDSLGRQTIVSYAGTGTPDVISYTGANGVAHSLSVSYDSLANLFSQTPSGQLLFSSISNSTTSASGYAVSKITLEDQSQYTFWYNSYGELARVVLPTGGAYEYDYPTAPTNACPTDPSTSYACVADGEQFISGNNSLDVKSVYRRLTERRTYSSGATASQ
jgi:hypothetical protein